MMQHVLTCSFLHAAEAGKDPALGASFDFNVYDIPELVVQVRRQRIRCSSTLARPTFQLAVICAPASLAATSNVARCIHV